MRTALMCLVTVVSVAVVPTVVQAQGTVPVVITVPGGGGDTDPAPGGKTVPPGRGRASLPRTGAELASLVVFGIALLAAGSALVGLSKARERGQRDEET